MQSKTVEKFLRKKQMVKSKTECDIELFDENDPIYSSVPAYMKLIDRNDKVVFLKMEVVKDWFFNHKGKKNAVPLNEIARQLKFSPQGNSADFRFIVAKLIEEENFPIVASPKGYYSPETVEDIDKNISQEENRIKGITRRINALKRMRGKYENAGKPE